MTGAPAAGSRCPRCGGAFHCGATGLAPCECTTIVLPPPLLADLQRRYRGCLCVDCLRALAASRGTATPEPQARRG